MCSIPSPPEGNPAARLLLGPDVVSLVSKRLLVPIGSWPSGPCYWRLQPSLREGGCALEGKARRELNASRRAGADGGRIADRCNLAEQWRREVHVRVAKLGVIEHVEDLHAEHQVGPLLYVDSPRYGCIELKQARAPDDICAGIAPGIVCRHRESLRIDPFTDRLPSGGN
jgi:hypothetical protein